MDHMPERQSTCTCPNRLPNLEQAMLTNFFERLGSPEPFQLS